MESTNQTASKPEATNHTENIINTAERLFQGTGFQKTTVADIARELQMSPANVYRFFTSRFEIEEAVCRRLLDQIQLTIRKEIAKSKGPASRTLRNATFAVSQMNTLRFTAERKLHELFETAHNENWPTVREHYNWIDKRFEEVIGEGMAAGEFRRGDAKLASRLFRSICLEFCNPRLMEETPRPAISEVVEFCLAALADKKGAETTYRSWQQWKGSGSATAKHVSSGATGSVGGAAATSA
jgi:AcrR family transcriptional regulator